MAQDFPEAWKDTAAYAGWNAAFFTVIGVIVSILGGELTELPHKLIAATGILIWFFAVVACASSKGPAPAIYAPLDWLRKFRDRTFGRDALLNWATNRFKPREGAFGFYNARVMDFALLVAVFYPILLPMLFWGWSGAAMDIAGVKVFPAESRWWWRAAAIGGIAPAFALAIYQSTAKERLSGFWLLIARAVAIAGAVVFAVADAGVFAGAIAFAIAVAIAGAGAGVFAGAFAIAFAFAIAVESAVIFAVIFAVAVVLAVAGAFAGAGWLEWPRDPRSAWLGLAYWGYVAVFLTALLLGMSYLPWGDADPEAPSLYLFLGLLPVINGVFDFLSYATTLNLFRWGRHSLLHAVIAGVGDVIAALALFFALGSTLIFVITWVNETAGVTFYNLDAFFAGELPQQGWVYFMVFSTILPTGLHFLHALMSTLVTFPAWAAAPLRKYVGKAASHPWAMIWAPLSVTLSGLGWFFGCLVIFFVPADYLFAHGLHLPDWLNAAITIYLQAIQTTGLWLAEL